MFKKSCVLTEGLERNKKTQTHHSLIIIHKETIGKEQERDKSLSQQIHSPHIENRQDDANESTDVAVVHDHLEIARLQKNIQQTHHSAAQSVGCQRNT